MSVGSRCAAWRRARFAGDVRDSVRKVIYRDPTATRSASAAPRSSDRRFLTATKEDVTKTQSRLSRSAEPEREGAALNDQRYTVDELRAELRRFEHELRAAGLKENSVTTYVDCTGRFLKWLDGEYQPKGPS